MSYTFTRQSISYGRYEPEGIYLSTPFEKEGIIVQKWGDQPAFYAGYQYNGTTLKGYIGLGFDLAVGTPIFAVDAARVVEISYEESGFGRYIKLEHRWGESLYACLRTVHVEAGQTVDRLDTIALSGTIPTTRDRRFHFGIRIRPYDRFDGWGGFCDPLPFLKLTELIFDDELAMHSPAYADKCAPLPMPVETPNMRRP